MSSVVYAKKNDKRSQSRKGKNDSGIRGSYLKDMVADAFDDAKVATDALAEAEGRDRRAKKAAREAKKAENQKEDQKEAKEDEPIPPRYCNKCYMSKWSKVKKWKTATPTEIRKWRESVLLKRPRQEFVEFECGRIWCGDCSKIKYDCGTCGGVVLGASKCVVCDVKTGKKTVKAPPIDKTTKSKSNKSATVAVDNDEPKSDIKTQTVKASECYICGNKGEKLYDYYLTDDDTKIVKCCQDTLKTIRADRCHVCQVWRNSSKCPNKACQDAIANGCYFCGKKDVELYDYHLFAPFDKIVKCCDATLRERHSVKCGKCQAWNNNVQCPNTNCQEEPKKEPKEKCDACNQTKTKTGFITIPQVGDRWCADCAAEKVVKPNDEPILCYVCDEIIDRNGPDFGKTYMNQHLCNTCYIGVKIELDTRRLSKCRDCIKSFPSSMKWTKTLQGYELLCPDCGDKMMAETEAAKKSIVDAFLSVVTPIDIGKTELKKSTKRLENKDDKKADDGKQDIKNKPLLVEFRPLSTTRQLLEGELNSRNTNKSLGGHLFEFAVEKDSIKEHDLKRIKAGVSGDDKRCAKIHIRHNYVKITTVDRTQVIQFNLMGFGNGYLPVGRNIAFVLKYRGQVMYRQVLKLHARKKDVATAKDKNTAETKSAKKQKKPLTVKCKDCLGVVYGPRTTLAVTGLCLDCMHLLRDDVDKEINRQATLKKHVLDHSLDADATMTSTDVNTSVNKKKRKAQDMNMDTVMDKNTDTSTETTMNAEFVEPVAKKNKMAVAV